MILVDDADLALFSRTNWNVNSRTGYVQGSIDGSKVYLHRVIMCAPSGYDVDHLNGVKTDNRRANLRIVRHRDNLRRRVKLNANNKSGYRGVSRCSRSGLWRARGRTGGREVMLGRFGNAEEAARVVDAWRRSVYGEFAGYGL